jgi:hypothetical protein
MILLLRGAQGAPVDNLLKTAFYPRRAQSQRPKQQGGTGVLADAPPLP